MQLHSVSYRHAALRPAASLVFLICRINLCVWGGARGLELVHRECGGSFWVSPVEEVCSHVVICN